MTAINFPFEIICHTQMIAAAPRAAILNRHSNTSFKATTSNIPISVVTLLLAVLTRVVTANNNSQLQQPDDDDDMQTAQRQRDYGHSGFR